MGGSDITRCCYSTPQTRLRQFDRPYRDLRKRVCESCNPVGTPRTALVHVAVHQTRNQSSCRTIDHSDRGSISLPVCDRAYPEYSSISNFYAHSGPCGRARAVPQSYIVNEQTHFNRALFLVLVQDVENETSTHLWITGRVGTSCTVLIYFHP